MTRDERDTLMHVQQKLSQVRAYTDCTIHHCRICGRLVDEAAELIQSILNKDSNASSDTKVEG